MNGIAVLEIFPYIEKELLPLQRSLEPGMRSG